MALSQLAQQRRAYFPSIVYFPLAVAHQSPLSLHLPCLGHFTNITFKAQRRLNMGQRKTGILTQTFFFKASLGKELTQLQTDRTRGALLYTQPLPGPHWMNMNI